MFERGRITNLLGFKQSELHRSHHPSSLTSTYKGEVLDMDSGESSGQESALVRKARAVGHAKLLILRRPTPPSKSGQQRKGCRPYPFR
jgi:hypothetical protein